MEMLRERAENEKYETICNYAFVHGQTHYQRDCRNRHLILSHDILDEPIVQCDQLIRFQMLKVRSPTEYVVRPLKVKYPSGWQAINSSEKYANDFYLRFVQHYKKRANRTLKLVINAGDLGVVLVQDGIPFRCEIIKQRQKL